MKYPIKRKLRIMLNDDFILNSSIKEAYTRLIIYVLFICTSLLYSPTVRSTNTIDSIKVQRFAGFCKVWGFLKYYQDDKIPKNVSWDSVFFKFTKEVELSKSNEDL